MAAVVVKVVTNKMGENSVVSEAQEMVIKSDDDCELYSISVDEDGNLHVRTSSHVKHNGVMLSPDVDVSGRSLNHVVVKRQVYND